jgi:hypothetical protein
MGRRELIVAGPADEPRVAEQVRELRADADGAQERELEVTERRADAFSITLVGKDGAVKARWEDVVSRGELWARIDAMPSRRRELRADAQETRSGPV